MKDGNKRAWSERKSKISHRPVGLSARLHATLRCRFDMPALLSALSDGVVWRAFFRWFATLTGIDKLQTLLLAFSFRTDLQKKSLSAGSGALRLISRSMCRMAN